ncbi:UNVERIFIED_CONTAM: hypothetical protein Slati_2853900 [Sesamum latifolium]|uniref:N-acetyltransferase domain-containing protein n=1 Tax=Sesamum latifolium TaxID=2727402 RepID=A0AAW2VGL1_9LAMI
MARISSSCLFFSSSFVVSDATKSILLAILWIIMITVSFRCGVSCFFAILFTPLSIPTWIEKGSNFSTAKMMASPFAIARGQGVGCSTVYGVTLCAIVVFLISVLSFKSPRFSRTSSHRIWVHCGLPRISSSWTMLRSQSAPTRKEKLSTPEPDKFSLSNIKFDRLQQTDEAAIQGHTLEFGQFVVREAQTDEEYWTAAWLRAESHREDWENDRYAENCKRIFAEQEFSSMKRRYITHLGEKCKCIVMVKEEGRNMQHSMLKSVVGTLDLSVRYFSHGETFPGEQVKSPLFCFINSKASSRYAYIANLCVARSERRQGIASSMLQFAIFSAKKEGAEKVFVHVYRNNKAAQGLYQKMGFEVVDAATSQLSADQMYLLCREASNWEGNSFLI